MQPALPTGKHLKRYTLQAILLSWGATTTCKGCFTHTDLKNIVDDVNYLTTAFIYFFSSVLSIVAGESFNVGM